MNLPSTSATQYFLMDASRKFVSFNQGAYPTLQVQSVVNRATQMPIIQATSANQPTWSGNGLSGTYSWRNNPGTKYSLPPGKPALVFAGSQYMEYDALATPFAAPESPLTIVSVVSPLSAGGAVWGFGDATDGYVLKLTYGSGSFTLTETNTHGTFTATATVAASAVHVVTAIRAGGNLTLRVDGAQVGTGAVTAGTVVPTTFVIGAVNANGTVGSQFNGDIGLVAAYGGAADIYAVETVLLLDYGVIRGATSGTNQGF